MKKNVTKESPLDEFLSKLSEKNLSDDKIDEIVASAKVAGLSAADIIRVQVAGEHKKGNKVFEPQYQSQEPTTEFLKNESEKVAQKSANLHDKKDNQFNPEVDIDQYGRIRNRNYGKDTQPDKTIKSEAEKVGMKPTSVKRGVELDL
jgi:hypothetical protein